jgi:hypothetical protein
MLANVTLTVTIMVDIWTSQVSATKHEADGDASGGRTAAAQRQRLSRMAVSEHNM